MKITKIGHCCLLIEVKEKRLLIDPGRYSTAQNEFTNIDAVLITHEHADHVDPGSLKKIHKNNPKVRIITHDRVAASLPEFSVEIVNNGDVLDIEGVPVEVHGDMHAEHHPTIERVKNLGYLIDSTFFYPGDSFYVPKLRCKAVAFPLVGGWMKMSQAMDFVMKMDPEIAFPVHEATLTQEGKESFYSLATKIISQTKIECRILKEGELLEV